MVNLSTTKKSLLLHPPPLHPHTKELSRTTPLFVYHLPQPRSNTVVCHRQVTSPTINFKHLRSKLYKPPKSVSLCLNRHHKPPHTSIRTHYNNQPAPITTTTQPNHQTQNLEPYHGTQVSQRTLTNTLLTG